MTASALRGPLLRAEFWIVWLLGACALACVPLVQGQSGIIWDALNHQIYLGWTAQHPRFDRDFLAAGWQSYQYPYLYWPAYRLAVSGASGATVGVALALLQSLAIPPLWLVARSLSPGESIEDIAWRALGVALALSGGLTLSLVNTTSNDMLTGIPLIWSVVFGMMACEPSRAHSRVLPLVALSGFLAGMAVAFKLSNGPLALVMPMLWLQGAGGASGAARRVLAGGVTTLLGFFVAYGWWGWLMWQQFGNPFYPFFDGAFDGLRAWAEWHRP